jgi:hypothetical protein
MYVGAPKHAEGQGQAKLVNREGGDCREKSSKIVEILMSFFF